MTEGMPTPGPWFICEGDHPADVRIHAPVHDPNWRGAAKLSKLVAVVGNAQTPWTDHVEEWHANAALIVKAVNGYQGLVDALRRLAGDVIDYERVNNLAPNPGRKFCWDSTENAVELLMSLGITELPVSADTQPRSAIAEVKP